MKRSALIAMATLVALGAVPMGSARADGPSDEANFVAQINALRATRGVPALQVDAGLTAKARSWAGTMAGRGTISHSSLTDGITATWRKLGENVGMGGAVDGLEAAFVNSPRHYDNLVDPAFGSIGIGVVRNAAGLLFVAEEFMQVQTPAASPAVSPAVSPATPVNVTVSAVKAPAAKVLKKVVNKKAAKKKVVRGKAKHRKVAPKNKLRR